MIYGVFENQSQVSNFVWKLRSVIYTSFLRALLLYLVASIHNYIRILQGHVRVWKQYCAICSLHFVESAVAQW